MHFLIRSIRPEARSLAIHIIFVFVWFDITLFRVALFCRLSQHAFVVMIFKGEAVGGEG